MIESLKDLKRLFELCRKQGVIEFDLSSMKFKLGDLPEKRAGQSIQSEDPLAGFPQGELTPEQLMFYSSGGVPENDPALKGE